MKLFQVLTLLFLFVLVINQITGTQANREKYLARVVVETPSPDLNGYGEFSNMNDYAMRLNYQMITKKAGVSGTSRSSQSGYFTISGQSTKQLSRFAVWLSPGDQCTIVIRVFQGSRKITGDTLVYHYDSIKKI